MAMASSKRVCNTTEVVIYSEYFLYLDIIWSTNFLTIRAPVNLGTVYLLLQNVSP